MHFAWTILKKGKREKITIHYIYTCARRAWRKRIKTFYKHAGLGGGGSVSIVAASKQGHCFTHSSGSISPLWFRSGLKNHKTFCDVFSNRFASVLQPLTQNEMWFFICFLTLFKHLSKGFQKFLKSSGIFIFVWILGGMCT